MLTRSSRSLLNLSPQYKVIPIVESRALFARAMETARVRAILLQHCNLFELAPLLESAYHRNIAVYVNIDHMDGITADAAGLRYLARKLNVTGIVSNHPRSLATGKSFGLQTVQRLFVVDSMGLEGALESVDLHTIDLLDISPALAIQYIVPYLQEILPLPFIGSGLISTPDQVQSVLRSGALAVAVVRSELWL